MKSFVVSLAALALIFGSAVHAQQFKWVDKSGKTQYGDNPPPGVKATPLKGPSTPPPAPVPAGKDAGKDAAKDAKKGPLTPAEQEQAFRKRQVDADKAREEAAKKEQEAAAKAANCNQARGSLRQLESGERVLRTDAKGERVFLEDSQRQQEIGRAQKSVSEWCG